MAKSKPQTPSPKKPGKVGRRAALAEQQKWITELVNRGWSYAQIGLQIDVRGDSISRWHRKQFLARGLGRKRLAGLVSLRKKPPFQESVAGLSGPITKAQRLERDTKAKQYKLYNPVDRARRIRRLAKDCGLTLPQLARLLHIGYKTTQKYTDLNHKAAIAPAVLDALINLINTHDLGAGVSPDAEFRNVARRLYGRFFHKGFTPGSPQLATVLDILEAYTGYSRRALRRYVPKPGGFGKRKFNPNKSLIRNLEALADLLEPKKNLFTTKRVLLPRHGGNLSSLAAVTLSKRVA